MSNREEFERIIRKSRPHADINWSPARGEYTVSGIQLKWEGYQMRQPEIDALKARRDSLELDIKILHRNQETLLKHDNELADELEARHIRISDLQAEVARLKANHASCEAVMGDASREIARLRSMIKTEGK